MQLLRKRPWKHPGRLTELALLAAVLTVPLAGCGGEGVDQAGVTTSGAAPNSATARPQTDSPTRPAFPITLTSGERTVEIATQPERIVSLSATATEMLFAIGAGERVVAADEYSDYPEQAPTTDLSGFTPNVEAISSYDPDLVVASGDPGNLVSSLDQIGVPTLIHPSATTLQDTYTQIEQLGAATGHVADAAAVVAQMQTELESIIEGTEGIEERKQPLTYYHELDKNFYSVTSETFIGQLYGLLGMRSIGDDAGGDGGPYPQLSQEFILDADPDVILLADAECCGVDSETIRNRPGWKQLSAVQNERIVELDEDIASRWGPRVVDFVDTIATQLSQFELVR